MTRSSIKIQNEYRVKWKVSLANGETLYEGKGDFPCNSWLKLQEYIAEKQTFITSLALYTDDGKSFNLPSSGKNPKFSQFYINQPPISYDFFRMFGGDVLTGDIKNYDLFARIIARYPNYNLEIYVDEKNPNVCWTLTT